MRKKLLFIAALLCVSSLPIQHIHAEENQVIRILFTNNLHQAFDPYTVDVESEEGIVQKTVGGFASIASILNSERNESTFVIDGGNFSVGTYYTRLNETYAPAMHLMDQMGYDVIALGDDEYQNVDTYLSRMIANSELTNSKLIYGNVNTSETENGIALQNSLDGIAAQSYTIIEKNGVKIGVFNIVEDTESETISTSNILNYAIDTVNVFVAEDVSYVVGVVNVSEYTLDQLVYHVEGIDLIIDNQSDEMIQPEPHNTTQIVSSGQNGRYVGELDVNVTTKTIESYSLIETNEDVGKDSNIQEMISSYQNTFDDHVFTPYGYSPNTIIATNPYEIEKINGKEFGNDTISNIVTDAYRFMYDSWYETWYYNFTMDKRSRIQAIQDELASQETDTENAEEVEPTEDPRITSIRAEEPTVKSNAIGIEQKSAIISTLPTGDVTVRNCYDVIREDDDNDTLVLVFMSGADLRHIAEFDATYARQTNPNMELVFSGLEYEYNDFRGDYNHVEDVYFDSVQGYYVPVKRRDLYPVVASVSTLNLLSRMEQLTDGILSVEYYDEDGNVIEDFSTCMLHYQESEQPLHKYVAVVQYLEEMEQHESTYPLLDEFYATKEIRKMENTSFNLIGYLKNPSLYVINRYKNYVVYAIALLIAYRIIRTILNRIFVKK